MALVRRRRASPAAIRLERQRLARVGAPTLRELLPAAAQVWVGLTFAADARLTPAPQVFTIYPPAQAHFVYACPFGDCDGIFDLNEQVFDMLRREASRTAGVLHCLGHRARRSGVGPRCGLGVAYEVTVRYGLEQPVAPVRLALAQ
jgi:hypothetical protein